jgi:leucyl/phenylalanyl-tRNA--protein transferase
VSAIDPEELLLAYRLGIFPMAESRRAKEVLWVRPHERGILPLDSFHVPRRLAETVRSGRYEVRIDTAFGEVIRGCAEARDDRRETWINGAIIDVFEALHARGLAHSVETWSGGVLAGGLYGLSLGAAFFAESKFSRQRDASKVALVHLAARLKAGGYLLLDAQFPNPHLEQFGAIAIAEEKFQHILNQALAARGDFYRLEGLAGNPRDAAGVSSPGAAGGGGISEGAPAAEVSPGGVTGSSVLQVITQTS